MPGPIALAFLTSAASKMGSKMFGGGEKEKDENDFAGIFRDMATRSLRDKLSGLGKPEIDPGFTPRELPDEPYHGAFGFYDKEEEDRKRQVRPPWLF